VHGDRVCCRTHHLRGVTTDLPQMTHLGNIISHLLLERSEINASAVAAKAGIDRSFLSRIIKGQASASKEVISKIALALGRNNSERSEIVAAYLKDKSCGYYPGAIQISVSKSTPHRSGLHPDIEYLQKHLSNPGIRKAVRGIVELHQKSGNKSGNLRNV